MRVSITPNPPGTPLARLAKGLRYGAEFARANYPDTPAVADAVTAVTVSSKAAVPGRTTFNEPDLAALGVVDAQTALLLAGESGFEAARGRMPERLFDMFFAR